MKRPEGRPHRAAVVVTSCSAAMLVLSPVSAIAGAPFRTDDPQPVELGHYEFYTFSTGMVVSGHTPGFLPAFEFNYGLIPEGQLHIVRLWHSTAYRAGRRNLAMGTPNWVLSTAS
jgi:hypothetical protein